MSNAVQVHQAEHRSLVEQIRHPKMQEQLRASLPPSVSLERFTAVTISAINQNADLLSADRQSFYNAVVKAAQEGLLPDGQDAILNIYNTNVAPQGQPKKWVQKVQYQRMVGGVVKQFKKAGIDAYACCVYKNERFELWNDETGQHIKHSPVPFGDKGEMIGVYAVAPLPSGKCVIATMDIESIERARAASKSGDKGPWSAWYDRMAEKSALHRLRKRVAIIDEQAAAELNKIDDEFESEDEPQAEPPKQDVPTGTEKRPKSLQSVVEQAGSEPQDAEHVPVSEDPGPQEGDII